MFLFRADRETDAAWQAWRAADVDGARSHALDLLRRGDAADQAHHLLAIAAHVQGDHATAIASAEAIGPRYRRRSELDEPILWSHVRRGDIAAAGAWAEGRGMTKSGAVRDQLRLAIERPFTVEASDIVELPFTGDAFTALMPGVAVRLNDRPLVARLDTGGSFVHVTRAQAQALGIASAGCERSFAGLVTAPVWYGVADLDLGAARLRNVPVHVHADGTLPIDTVAKAFGADVGLLIGTGVFERFLTTIDAPGGRLVLSRRGDAAQLARWTGRAHDVPFLLLGSHIMVARGRVGERPVNFFVDSGLAVFNHEQGQAGLLLPRRTLEAWNLRAPSGHAFAAIPSPVGVGSAVRERLTAFVVSNRTWRQFGTWNGLDVTALLSHAFLKHFAWTLDFDRQVYWLRDARHGEETIARN